MKPELIAEKHKSKTFDLIVPVYNEEDTIESFLDISKTVLGELNYKIVFINDGSSDNTYKLLTHLQKNDKRIILIDLSRNFGKEAAVMAGLKYTTADAAIIIDVDLQDPLDLIPMMLKKWHDGFEVVLGKRENRDSDNFAKRVSAKLFYRLFNLLSSRQIPENVGDFRLLDREVVSTIASLKENNLFLKGLMSWVGYRTVEVSYVRQTRSAGNTKFNVKKLFSLAFEGVVNFSIMPLRIWSFFGAALACISMMYAFALIVRFIFYGIEVPGYLSVIITSLIMGGIQLMGLGLIGEYIGRIYIEAKARPQFIVREVIENNEEIEN